MEKIIENKICKHCKSSFEITDKDLEFYEKVSPVFDGKKYNIPSPTLCPDCRALRRLSWRNERNLYKRKCDASGEDIVSIYSPDKPYKVYKYDFWQSDKRTPLDYGKVYDFSKSFFEQFGELIINVPKQNVIGSNNYNSEYSNLSADNQNCYLIFESSNNQDCYYGYRLQKCKDCVDCGFMHECIKCYESENCNNCYNSNFLFNCNNCRDSSYLEDCIGCQNCFCCDNLVNKKYFIFNKEYKEEDYKIEIKKFYGKNNLDVFLKFKIGFAKKYSRIINSENCSGDWIENSKDCLNCFHSFEAENCKYGEHIWRGAKYCMDVSTAGREVEKIYESINCGISDYNINFSVQCWICSRMNYCANCFSSSDCFGCVGLKSKSFCISNKQYTKEEYNELVPKIIEHMIGIGEWGEFFPSSISTFGYNETVANEYFPIEIKTGLSNKDIKYIDTEGNNYKDLKEAGERPVFKYSDYESPIPKVDKIIPASKLPENISDIPDDILNWAIECEITKKPFRIIKEELEFYRKHNLPIPRRHPDQRHLDRMKLRNPRKLFDRKCGKCKKDIKTTYSKERKEIIYCEECYNKEIY